MYESPINLVVQDITTQMKQEEEKMILEAIRKYGVVVDKEELIKALEYDRNQYSKGYKDGVNDVLDKIRAEIEEAKTYDGVYIGRAYVLEIIDKYKESKE